LIANCKPGAHDFKRRIRHRQVNLGGQVTIAKNLSESGPFLFESRRGITLSNTPQNLFTEGTYLFSYYSIQVTLLSRSFLAGAVASMSG
jgi:hypothetical protein